VAEAEGVAGGVEQHTDIVLWLMLYHRCPEGHGLGDGSIEVAHLEVEVLIGRRLPSVGGQTGAP
jgi:hypothetical protein